MCNHHHPSIVWHYRNSFLSTLVEDCSEVPHISFRQEHYSRFLFHYFTQNKILEQSIQPCNSVTNTGITCLNNSVYSVNPSIIPGFLNKQGQETCFSTAHYSKKIKLAVFLISSRANLSCHLIIFQLLGHNIFFLVHFTISGISK
jgi:hypothetical protein